MSGDRTHAWEPYLGRAERAMADSYRAAPATRTTPALLLVDLYNKAYGDRREPIDVSRERFASSCGEAAWDALGPTSRLLEVARATGIPVVYSTGETRPEARVGAATKRARRADDPWSLAIKDELAPADGELVVYKNAPSAFFGTSLSTHLRRLGVDGVIVTGETTSGCVRASAVDAYSHGFTVVVVEDACFDRSPLSHAASLFDLDTKYARVRWSDDVLDALQSAASAGQTLPTLSM